FPSETNEDREIIKNVMRATGVEEFSDLTLEQLSGGEKQRVLLAQALAQEPKALILDEPTNHLDLAYQKEILDSLNDTIESDDLTVVAIFHDLNIESLYCTHVIVLDKLNDRIC